MSRVAPRRALDAPSMRLLIGLGYVLLALILVSVVLLVPISPPLRPVFVAAAVALICSVALVHVLLVLHHERHERLRLRTSLTHLSRQALRLRQQREPQALFEAVAASLQTACDLSCTAVTRIDWATGNVVVAAAVGKGGQRLPTAEAVRLSWDEWTLLFETGRQLGPHTYRCAELPFRRVRSEVHVAHVLLSGLDEPLGVLTVSWPATRPPSAELMPLLHLLAVQVELALDNHALRTSMEQRLEESLVEAEQSQQLLRRERDRVQLLYQFSRALASRFDEEQILSRAQVLLAHVSGAERGGVMLLDAGGTRLTFRCSIHGGVSQGASLESNQGLAGWVLAQKRSAVIADTSRDARWQVRSSYDTHGRAALALPLLHESRALGVVVLLHSSPGHFHETQAEVLEAACTQFAAQLIAARRHRAALEQTEKVGKVARERDAEATRMRAVLLSIADGVVVGDRMGRVLLANAAAEHMLGIRADRFMGRSLAELPGVGHGAPIEGAAVQQICVGGRTLRAHFAPVLTQGGEWHGSIVTYHDMTHQALAERHKSEFVAMASHELRTPLTAMRGYVDLLLLGTAGALNEGQQAFLTIIKTNAARQIDLIEDLLDMSKIEAGEAKLRPEELHVVEVVEEVTQALYGEFAAQNITLELDLPPELPPVMADRQRVAQIMMNLVGNACKYTPPGGCVRVALHATSAEVEVLVRDSGVGISEHAKPYIFSRFFRADNPLRDKVKGTGLGLAITKMLVELHGGRIWFESEEGRGSTFVFTLPVDHDRLDL